MKVVDILNTSYSKSNSTFFLQDITSRYLLVALQVFLSMSDEQNQSEEIQNHPTENQTVIVHCFEGLGLK